MHLFSGERSWSSVPPVFWSLPQPVAHRSLDNDEYVQTSYWGFAWCRHTIPKLPRRGSCILRISHNYLDFVRVLQAWSVYLNHISNTQANSKLVHGKFEIFTNIILDVQPLGANIENVFKEHEARLGHWMSRSILDEEKWSNEEWTLQRILL